jgi:deazaflavin-dependent oxidoreductase (nitroreductase family)
MTDWSSPTFEDDLIADMRANDGRVTAGPLAGDPLLVMWSTGAKTGERRRSILTYSRDGGAYVVAGSNGGAKTHAHWVTNVAADPKVTIETGNRTFAARASIAPAVDRDRLWEQHVAALPQFAAYPEKVGRRVIPVVTITPDEG